MGKAIAYYYYIEGHTYPKHYSSRSGSSLNSKMGGQIMMIFINRTDAGRFLALELRDRYDRNNLLVLGLPRGGVVVALEVAATLHAPLDLFLVRKVGVPKHEEVAMGAIASGDVVVRNQSILEQMNISEEIFLAAVQRERAILTRREAAYRDDRPPVEIQDRTVILVDDGLATGASMAAAIEGVQAQNPRELVVAVPLGARETCNALRRLVDDLICLAMPDPFFAVGQWYHDFDHTTDEEVHQSLKIADEYLAVTT